jgi:hypothetical protein
MKTMTIAILFIAASNLFSQETKTAVKADEPKVVTPKAVDLKTEIKISNISVYNSGTFRDYVAIKSLTVESTSDIPLAVEVKVTYWTETNELGSRNLKMGILPRKSTSAFSVESENKELTLQPERTEIRTDGDVIRHTHAVVTVHSAVPSNCEDRAVHFTADMLAAEISVEERKADDAWLYFVMRANRADQSGLRHPCSTWDGSTTDLARFHKESGNLIDFRATTLSYEFAVAYIEQANQYLGRAKLLVTLHGEKADLGASKTLRIKESRLTNENADALRKAIGAHGARLAAIDGIGIKVAKK